MSNAPDNSAILVVFGASGDLTRRKLLPALYNLAEDNHLPAPFALLGVARPAMSDEQFRATMREHVEKVEAEPLDVGTWNRLAATLHYISGEFDDPALYARLAAALEEMRRAHGMPANYLFYFAIPPDLFGRVAAGLATAGLTRETDGWRRVIVEKPFGYDLASARALNAQLTAALDESQIYRIDHYLGKETVQNILAFRFANGIFEPIWNRRYVDHVQMTVAEEVGVEGRGGYYDNAGALRDIVQNHMFQLLTLVAMEPPISFHAEDVRNEKVKVLHAVPAMGTDEIRRRVVRAQYEGYPREPNVSPASRTETFVAMELLIDNWRWAGVPFFLRTGKRLPKRATEIAVVFKRAPLALFRDVPVNALNPNVLVLRIQPNEGIALSFDAKVPGPFERLATVTMDFSYAEYFNAEPSTGYETLLFDAMSGDQTLFHRMDIVEAGWAIVDPILAEEPAVDPTGSDRRPQRPALHTYEPGSWGPPEADLLLEPHGREWRC